jgi:hypothetical protein
LKDAATVCKGWLIFSSEREGQRVRGERREKVSNYWEKDAWSMRQAYADRLACVAVLGEMGWKWREVVGRKVERGARRVSMK